jgi:flagellar assembly protein FliH
MSEAKETLKRLSAFISGEQADAFKSWQPPEMVGKSVNKDIVDPRQAKAAEPSANTTVTAQSLEQITKQAYEEGFAKGQTDGREAGLQVFKEKVLQVDAVINALRAKSEQFDEQVTQQLLEMTISIAKQIIRRELTTHPDEIMAVIQEAIALMPDHSANLTLKLHPEDALLVKEIYDMQDSSNLSWKLFEDPAIQRGGCILTSDTSEINAELDKRIQTLVTQLIGGDRNDD